MNERYAPLIFVGPVILLLMAFNIFPLIWSLGLSFYQYSIMRARLLRFVGLENYVRLLSDPEVWIRFQITGKFIVLAVGLEFLIGFAMALLLRGEFKGKRIVVTLLLMPMMIAPVATALFFRYLFDRNWGIINYFTSKLFGIQIYWLGADPSPLLGIEYALLSLVLVDVWMWSPFMMLIILAGLSAIPREVFEVAELDRISFVNKLRYVIIPYIRPVLLIALVLRTMDAFKTFDTVYVLTAGGPGITTELISVYIYKLAFLWWDMGGACALSYIVLAVIVFLTNVYMRYLSR